eukprot:1112208-Pyramimonas_sp.AAC.1
MAPASMARACACTWVQEAQDGYQTSPRIRSSVSHGSNSQEARISREQMRSVTPPCSLRPHAAP